MTKFVHIHVVKICTYTCSKNNTQKSEEFGKCSFVRVSTFESFLRFCFRFVVGVFSFPLISETLSMVSTNVRKLYLFLVFSNFSGVWCKIQTKGSLQGVTEKLNLIHDPSHLSIPTWETLMVDGLEVKFLQRVLFPLLSTHNSCDIVYIRK